MNYEWTEYIGHDSCKERLKKIEKEVEDFPGITTGMASHVYTAEIAVYVASIADDIHEIAAMLKENKNGRS